MGVDREGKFTVVKGDSETVKCELRDALAKPVSVVGASIIFRLSDGSSVILEKSSDDPNEIEITDGANGQFTLKLLASDLQISPTSYFYEYEITLSDGTIITPVQGDFELIAQLG